MNGQAATREGLVAWYDTGDGAGMCCRSVGGVVRSGVIDVPAPPARLLADWAREISSHLDLPPGGVEPLPLPRVRLRWPEHRHCIEAVAAWSWASGLGDLPAAGDIALMACRGAPYHHDGDRYGASAFCNLFLTEDCGLDAHFPVAGHRIPLRRGTVMLFDTGQPHAVVERGRDRFDTERFGSVSSSGSSSGSGMEKVQIFLTWEVPIDTPGIAHALGVVFGPNGHGTLAPAREQVWNDGVPVRLCPVSGRFLPPEAQETT